MRLATQADFEQGGLYTSYRRYPFFAERAAAVVAAYGSVKTLVVGCGWGYLVDELLRLGVDAWGIDASLYAITKGKAVAGMLPATLTRLSVADATNRTQLTAVRTTAGLVGSARFGLVVTEDMLPMLTDAEVTTAVTECRRIATNMLHIVTPGTATDASKLTALNWKSTAAWKALVAPDAVMDAEARNRIV